MARPTTLRESSGARDVPPQTTYDLRRRVLRDDRPEAEVRFAGDEADGALHLAVLEDGTIKGVVSAVPSPAPSRPGRRALRVRGLAVDEQYRRSGVGACLVDAVTARASAAGVEVLWAHARDSALDFYRSRGWTVEGDGFLSHGIAHHRAVLDL